MTFACNKTDIRKLEALPGVVADTMLAEVEELMGVGRDEHLVAPGAVTGRDRRNYHTYEGSPCPVAEHLVNRILVGNHYSVGEVLFFLRLGRFEAEVILAQPYLAALAGCKTGVIIPQTGIGLDICLHRILDIVLNYLKEGSEIDELTACGKLRRCHRDADYLDPALGRVLAFLLSSLYQRKGYDSVVDSFGTDVVDKMQEVIV